MRIVTEVKVRVWWWEDSRPRIVFDSVFDGTIQIADDLPHPEIHLDGAISIAFDTPVKAKLDRYEDTESLFFLSISKG